MRSQNEIADWRQVAPSLVEIDFHDRTTIYAQGDELAFLFFVSRGVVRLSHVTEDGAQLTISVLGPGSLFGSASSTKISEQAATSIGEVRVLRLALSDVARLVEKKPAFAAFLNAGLELSRERTERKLIALTKTVESRLIETLCELALMFGAPCPHGYSLEIKLTQQDLADLVHASRPVVAKVMNALRRRGALDYTRELICVNDAALRSVARV